MRTCIDGVVDKDVRHFFNVHTIVSRLRAGVIFHLMMTQTFLMGISLTTTWREKNLVLLNKVK